MGRPSKYSPEIAELIIERTCDGQSLSEICRGGAFPSRQAVYRWLDEHEGFRNKYARATDIRAHKVADEVIEIADTEPDPQKARNRIDARKWAAGKMLPKVYGDRAIVQGTGDKDDAIHVDGPAGVEQIIGILARIASRGGATEDPQDN